MIKYKMTVKYLYGGNIKEDKINNVFCYQIDNNFLMITTISNLQIYYNLNNVIKYECNVMETYENVVLD